jgi:hypothetical protein
VTYYPSISASLSRKYYGKLDVNVLIYGVVVQTDSLIRINASLVNTRTGDVFRSFQEEGIADEKNAFKMMDSVSVSISGFLIKSKMGREGSSDLRLNMNSNFIKAF